MDMQVIGKGAQMNVVGRAKIFNGGVRVGYCLDTPKGIRAALRGIAKPDYPFAKNCVGEVVSLRDLS